MGRVFQPLLFFLARCTRNELIRHIEFLKTENQLLRKRVPKKAIILTREEKEQLIKFGASIGPGLEKLITIVGYGSYLRWIRQLKNQSPIQRLGRPRTAEATRELILKRARENNWGCTRILGELRELGFQGISRQTVVNILKREGLGPDSPRGPGTWNELLKTHAETLWQCDFFSKRVLSRLGMPQVFALVFLNVATRRVWVRACTRKPTAEWVAERAQAYLTCPSHEQLPVRLVSRDRDNLYCRDFDQVLEQQGADVMHLVFRSPNLNAYVERYIQSVQVECLDHFLVFGEKHFDYLVREYVEHYHQERPHQGLENRLISGEPPPAGDGEVQCRTRLGGLLKHYFRAAA